MMVSWDCSNIGNSWHPAASIDPGYTAFFSGIKTGIKVSFFRSMIRQNVERITLKNIY